MPQLGRWLVRVESLLISSVRQPAVGSILLDPEDKGYGRINGVFARQSESLGRGGDVDGRDESNRLKG